MRTLEELDQYITERIQGVFSQTDMAVLRREIEKLKPDDVYVEFGVNEGKSARVAHEYGNPDVYKLFIDCYDVVPHEVSIGRAPFMESEGMVGIGKKGFYVHGDGDLFPGWIMSKIPFVNLIFLDPHHDYESIKSATLAWEPLVKKGGVLLFHDYDHPDTKKFLDDHYGDNKEVFHGKIVKVVK